MERRYYVIQNKTSKKFVMWVNSKGNIIYRKNAPEANYFIDFSFADAWRKEKKLGDKEFEVVAFEFIP